MCRTVMPCIFYGIYMKCLKYAMILLVSVCAGFICGVKYSVEFHGRELNVKADTLIVHDTVLYERPVPMEIRTVDTLMIAVVDTVVLYDTSYVMLPMQQRVYCDSTYRALVSGYKPALDTISVYPLRQYITTVRTVSVPSRKRWGIGVHAGYGIYMKNNAVNHAPYVGIGLSYNFISF